MDTIMHMIVNQGVAHPDILELTKDNPTIVLGSKIDSVDSEDKEVHPFNMSLNIHDMVLHNSMLDSGLTQSNAERSGGKPRVGDYYALQRSVFL